MMKDLQLELEYARRHLNFAEMRRLAKLLDLPVNHQMGDPSNGLAHERFARFTLESYMALVKAEIELQRGMLELKGLRVRDVLKDRLGLIAARAQMEQRVEELVYTNLDACSTLPEANIIRGITKCKAGQYADALYYLTNITPPLDPIICSLYLQGMSALVYAQIALRHYREALSLINQLNLFVEQHRTNIKVIDRANYRWIEEIFYFSPFLKFILGDKIEALRDFRNRLRAPWTSDYAIRMSLLRNCARLLLGCFSASNYIPLVEENTDECYVPKNIKEELVLLVYLIEAEMTCLQYPPIPQKCLKDLYDEITVILTFHQQFNLLLEVQERSKYLYYGGPEFFGSHGLLLLKFCRYEEAHLSLIHGNREDEFIQLIIIWVLLNHLQMPEKTSRIIQQGIALDGKLKSRFYQFSAISHLLLGRKGNLSEKKRGENKTRFYY